MTEITIRRMRAADCPRAAALARTCFSRPWTEDGFRETFRVPGYVSLIAEDGGRLVGYIGRKDVPPESDITIVAVAAAYRRQGLGKRLLAALLAEAREAGIEEIFLEVRRSNAAAIRLYAGEGFRTVGERRNYYEKPREDALLMRWASANSY